MHINVLSEDCWGISLSHPHTEKREREREKMAVVMCKTGKLQCCSSPKMYKPHTDCLHSQDIIQMFSSPSFCFSLVSSRHKTSGWSKDSTNSSEVSRDSHYCVLLWCYFDKTCRVRASANETDKIRKTACYVWGLPQFQTGKIHKACSQLKFTDLCARLCEFGDEVSVLCYTVHVCPRSVSIQVRVCVFICTSLRI